MLGSGARKVSTPCQSGQVDLPEPAARVEKKSQPVQQTLSFHSLKVSKKANYTFIKLVRTNTVWLDRPGGWVWGGGGGCVEGVATALSHCAHMQNPKTAKQTLGNKVKKAKCQKEKGKKRKKKKSQRSQLCKPGRYYRLFE